ncbi:MAG: hypothetical protein AAGM21_12245 [Pseudomonadota bacterium]
MEASGVWRPGPSEQRLNVVVSIGSATLTITDMKDTALAHWSLPAVERVNPGADPAIYRAAKDAEDRLEIADPEMIAAIEQVRRAVVRGQTRPGRLRGGFVGLAVVGVIGAMLVWAPGAIRNQAAGILPEASRAALGRDVFEKIHTIAGRPCSDPLGQQALDRLASRFAPGARVYVMPSGLASSATLPGDHILLGRSVVEDHDTPFVVAGFLVEADLSRQLRDPAMDLLADATLLETGRLLTTGDLAERALVAHAERRVKMDNPSPDDGDLIARFAALGLPTEPFAYAKDISGESVASLIEAAPVAVDAAAAPLSDGDWVALQGICGE